MSSIRKTIITNCEKNFLIKNLSEWTRLDGRAFNEFRNVKIEFGKDWGCCKVSLGKTMVISQVSCELQQPKSSRPNEGVLNINLELNPMAEQSFEAGRQSDLSSQLNRLLEKCIKDSKAVDLESLCVKVNEKAWAFRVDINVLNHEGNILDCASIAALSSLAHFRRPDVTCDGEEYKIHNVKQRDPIPTVIHHYPVCITYAIVKEGEYILADPTLLEEGVAEAFLTIGLNAYKELCGLHLGGNAHLTTKAILETSNKAAKRAVDLVQLIKEAVENDTNERLTMKSLGFHNTLDKQISDVHVDELGKYLDHWTMDKIKRNPKKNQKVTTPMEETESTEEESEEDESMDVSQEKVESITNLGDGTAKLDISTAQHEWITIESDEESEKEDDVIIVEPKVETLSIDSNSEEEQVLVLNPVQRSAAKKKKKKKKNISS